MYVSALIVLTLGLMCLNDLFNRYLIFSTKSTNSYKMYRMFRDYPKGEIPIIGSSRAETGFVPREISANAFNYGMSGSIFRESVLHLRQVLTRDDCRLVILNLEPWGLPDNGFTGDYRFVAEERLVEEERARIVIPLTNRIPGIRFHGQIRKNLAAFLNNRLAMTKTMEAGAALLRLHRSETEWKYILANLEVGKFVEDAETKKRLERTLLNNDKAEIVFVISPVADVWWKSFIDKEKTVALVKWLRGFKHVHVFDDISDGYTLYEFADPTHLNENGARKFSKALGKRLVENGIL